MLENIDNADMFIKQITQSLDEKILVEITIKKKIIRGIDKIKNKLDARKNKGTKKIDAKKYRKSAAGKKHEKKRKIMVKRGKTATGKLITKKS